MSKLATKTFTSNGSFTVPAGITKLMCFVNPTTTLFGSFSQIYAGNTYSAGLKSDGSIWTWGINSSGELANNTLTSASSPVSVAGNISFAKLNTGNSASNGGALKADGSAWTWGTGGIGKLGDNSTTTKSSPVSVVGANSYTKLSIGPNANAAIRGSDGSAWCWGDGTVGQLGNNTLTNISSPVSVVGNISFSDINTGQNSGVGGIRASDGSAWCWGDNPNGQLGDNTVTSRSSPVSVVGNHSFVNIFSGLSRFIALKADGSAWAWGRNNLGDLGDNTITNRSSPVSVLGNNSYTKIATGNENFGIRGSDGSVWAWGQNSFGALGDRTTDAKSSPVSVVGNHSFSDIKCESDRVLALKADNSVWTWGRQNNTLGFNILSPIPLRAPVNITNLSNNSLRYLNVTPNSSVSFTLNTGIWTMTSGSFTNILGFSDQLTIAWVE